MDEEQPQRTCFRCRRKPITAEHILCTECRDELNNNSATYWQTHRQVGDRVERIDDASA